MNTLELNEIDILIAKWENELTNSNNGEIVFKFSDYTNGRKLGKISQLVLCLNDLKNLKMKLASSDVELKNFMQ